MPGQRMNTSRSTSATWSAVVADTNGRPEHVHPRPGAAAAVRSPARPGLRWYAADMCLQPNHVLVYAANVRIGTIVSGELARQVDRVRLSGRDEAATIILDLVSDLKYAETSPSSSSPTTTRRRSRCAIVNILQHGRITFDRPATETSVAELTELMVADYRGRRGDRRPAPVTRAWCCRVYSPTTGPSRVQRCIERHEPCVSGQRARS